MHDYILVFSSFETEIAFAWQSHIYFIFKKVHVYDIPPSALSWSDNPWPHSLGFLHREYIPSWQEYWRIRFGRFQAQNKLECNLSYSLTRLNPKNLQKFHFKPYRPSQNTWNAEWTKLKFWFLWHGRNANCFTALLYLWHWVAHVTSSFRPR